MEDQDTLQETAEEDKVVNKEVNKEAEVPEKKRQLVQHIMLNKENKEILRHLIEKVDPIEDKVEEWPGAEEETQTEEVSQEEEVEDEEVTVLTS